MNKENTETLFTLFPSLYRGKTESVSKNLIPLGFDCNDGWFSLIYDLSKEITKLDPEGLTKATQVKEKFGGLRFYVNSGTNEIYDLIDKYEAKSYTICEECGNAGWLRDDLSWIKTLCHKCYKRRNQNAVD